MKIRNLNQGLGDIKSEANEKTEKLKGDISNLQGPVMR